MGLFNMTLLGLRTRLAVMVALCALIAVPVTATAQAGWLVYGQNPQHTGISPVKTQAMSGIHWSAQLEIDPVYWGNELLIHYGCPLVTTGNTLVIPVKIGDNFHFEGHRATTGALLWSVKTDYTVPPHDWYPSCGSSISPSGQLIVPGAGGTVYVISHIDTANPTVTQVVFYGAAVYASHKAAFNAGINICTPITCSGKGDIYFGYQVVNSVPNGLTSGWAHIGANGADNWVTADTAAGVKGVDGGKPTLNCAPAVTTDGKTVYAAANNYASGNSYLIALDSQTLATKGIVSLLDPHTGQPADDIDDSTATPCIGPDGDVYYGVLETPFASNHDRGWMLHFDSTLKTTKIPGMFGWDDTASIVPAAAVPSYHGKSSYLILTKYNNYADTFAGGDGLNKLAVLDPNASQNDPATTTPVMQEVITLLGITPDPGNRTAQTPNAVREWCVNTVAIDPFSKSAIVNSEDGTAYRWDFKSNSITERVVLTGGIGEAYTPTVVGPDGTMYAVSNAVVYAIGPQVPTKLLAQPVTGYVGQTVQLAATLVQSANATPIANQAAVFSIAGQVVGTAITDDTGTAVMTYAIPANAWPGVDLVQITFPGTSAYTTSKVSTLLIIHR